MGCAQPAGHLVQEEIQRAAWPKLSCTPHSGDRQAQQHGSRTKQRSVTKRHSQIEAVK